MTFDKISRRAVRKLTKSIPQLEFTDAQLAEVRRLIDSALSDAVAEASDIHRKATTQCCGRESDLARRIAERTDHDMRLAMIPLQHIR